MNSWFFEHKKLSSEELKNLWNECIFVFDTNVLLNFYRYSSNTYKELEEALVFYKARIWIPNQVGIEFFNNRLSVINEQRRNYSEPTKSLKVLKEILRNKKGHPFISNDVFEEFEAVVEKIEGEFNEQEKSLSSLINKDLVVEMIFNLFDGRTGGPYEKEKLLGIYSEGKIRYSEGVPPGYRDIKKPEPDRYGDLIIWKQIIDKAKEVNKPIIFISDDEKEDWLLINSNKIVSPLPKLIKEFFNLTNQKFYIYQAFQFLKFTYEDRNREIDQPSIDEIKYIGSYSLENEIDPVFYSIDFTIKDPKHNTELLETFIKVIEELGYNLAVNEIAPYIYHISLNVPFEDLIRRFSNILNQILPQYNLELIDFISLKNDKPIKEKRQLNLF